MGGDAVPDLDPRGPRFGAAVTSVVLVGVLLTGSGWLALGQTVVFAITAADPRRGPYALLYRLLLAPRLAPPVEREPAAPVRFAQLVGLVFGVLMATAYLAGWPVAGAVVAGVALVAAFLNAAFGLCLGCDAYLVLRRLNGRPSGSA